MAIRQELILLIKFHLAEIYWAKLMIGCSWFERNLQFVLADCAPVSVPRDSGVDALCGENVALAFDYTFTCGDFEAEETWALEKRLDRRRERGQRQWQL
jgi:hypothetical protein